MARDYELLKRAILDYIEARQGDSMRFDRNGFERLALEIFRWQYERNGLYCALCEARGRSPGQVDSVTAIPAVPTSAFKGRSLFSFSPDAAAGWFATSGTTVGIAGRRYYRDLDLYAASWPGPFQRALVTEDRQLPIASLIPRWSDAPHSSLAYMVEGALDRWGAIDSASFCGSAFDWTGLFSRLDAVSGESSVPVLLLGTAFGWVYFLDEVERRGLSGWRLPSGSRLMETGGYKGRTRQVPREELRAGLRRVLGLGVEGVVGEYGMTELSSQFYERFGEGMGSGDGVGVFGSNPWALVTVTDPWTGEVIPPWAVPAGAGGRRGLLRVYDLCNLDSVMAIQTEDMAELHADGGFRLLGRASGAELRGCSLGTEFLEEGDTGG